MAAEKRKKEVREPAELTERVACTGGYVDAEAYFSTSCQPPPTTADQRGGRRLTMSPSNRLPDLEPSTSSADFSVATPGQAQLSGAQGVGVSFEIAVGVR